MATLDYQANQAEIKVFKRMLRNIEDNYGVVKSDAFWREYCYRMGNVIEIILKEMERKESELKNES